ncbi:hypothetical protein RJ641_012473 [Dillenia turbinata]|uniref:Mitotic checkpoint protein bub3 n=1 Tax=Dillenia turbinata TaxID=194707 RepID=A0AAN8V1K7_9MAGN
MSGTSLKFENPINDAITRIHFAPQSYNLLISSWDSNLRLYDVQSSMMRLEAPTEAALLDCCFQSESIAFTAASDGSITRFDMHSGNSEALGHHDDLATCVEYSDQTCQTITAGWDNKIMSWDTRLAKPLGCLKLHGASVESLTLCGLELVVATGASINMYDFRNLSTLGYSKELWANNQISSVQSLPDSRGFAVGSVDGRVSLEFPTRSGPYEKGYMFRCHPKLNDGRRHLVAVSDIAFNPLSSGTFATGDYEGYVIIWDARSRKRIFELPRYPSSVASLSFNQHGQLLAVASSYMYQEGKEIQVPPQIFIHQMNSSGSQGGKVSSGNE